jgi:GTP-binding protein
VGRPNVGKSSLFNRLIGKRKAIVHEEPGVTRDPISEAVTINGTPLLLIDTGGLRFDADGIEERAAERSRKESRQANLILLVLDVTEVTPEDEEVIAALRPYADRIIPVINKVDNDIREQQVWNFYSLGLSEVFPVSAAHGIHIDELRDEIVRRVRDYDARGRENAAGIDAGVGESEKTTAGIDAGIGRDADGFAAAAENGTVSEEEIRISIIGKPNTGKSTLVNTLIGTDVSLVSEIPGTTRDVIEGVFRYKSSTFQILDTAGIRRKNKVHADLEYYSVNRAIASINDADIVFLMLDATEELSDQDKKIASLAVDKGKGIILVLNKWDLVGSEANRFNAMRDRIAYVFPILRYAPVKAVSALKGKGIPSLLDSAVSLYGQLGRRIDTGRLNQALLQWTGEHPPPRAKSGAPYKARYITQVSVRPLRFILFTNKKKGFPGSYLGYITNRIREEFDFSSVPLELELRGRERR